jgi:hypothetical protein
VHLDYAYLCMSTCPRMSGRLALLCAVPWVVLVDLGPVGRREGRSHVFVDFNSAGELEESKFTSEFLLLIPTSYAAVAFTSHSVAERTYLYQRHCSSHGGLGIRSHVNL